MTQAELQDAADSGAVIPPGEYLLTEPLVLGDPTTFTTRHLRGSGRCPFGEAGYGGTVLRAAFEFPAIAVVGARNSSISNLSLVGPYYDELKWQPKGPDLSDWPGSSDVLNPSAGIAVDPNLTGPWSSGLLLNNVEISGFAVGIVTQPGGADSQGEFVTAQNCGINFCGYGVSISQQQNRRLAVRDCDFLSLHTALTNNAHGKRYGRIDGGFHSCSFNEVERLFDLYGNCGITTFDGGCAELLGSLGQYRTGGHRTATPVSIRNVDLRFRTDRPATLYGVGGGQVRLEGGSVETEDIAVFDLDLLIDGVRFRPVRYERGPVSPALRRAVSFTKGHILWPALYGSQPWRPHSAAWFPNSAVDLQLPFGTQAKLPKRHQYDITFNPDDETAWFPAGVRVFPGDVVVEADTMTVWVVMGPKAARWQLERVNNRGRTPGRSWWLVQPG